MVKIFVRITGTFILLILLFLVWMHLSRSFYCLEKGKCVTVWKRLGNECYIIPGKYYGLIKPSGNYIKTNNTQLFTLYFSKDIPNTIVLRNQGSFEGTGGKYDIINNSSDGVKIAEYSDDYEAILYKSDADNFFDIQENTEIIELIIKESYALDNTGKKIE